MVEERELAAGRMLPEQNINDAMRRLTGQKIGVIDHEFLSQTLSILGPAVPVCVSPETSVASVVAELRRLRVGCVLVVDGHGALMGMFSERDYVLKVPASDPLEMDKPVSAFMTCNPVSASFDTPIAYALNLMSQGGFRHLPIVDDEGGPVGIISVKDIVDHMVRGLMHDLLNFEPMVHV